MTEGTHQFIHVRSNIAGECLNILAFEITKFERCHEVTSTSVIQIPDTPAPIITKDVKLTSMLIGMVRYCVIFKEVFS